jgi:hypothetical protein
MYAAGFAPRINLNAGTLTSIGTIGSAAASGYEIFIGNAIIGLFRIIADDGINNTVIDLLPFTNYAAGNNPNGLSLTTPVDITPLRAQSNRVFFVLALRSFGSSNEIFGDLSGPEQTAETVIKRVITGDAFNVFGLVKPASYLIQDKSLTSFVIDGGDGGDSGDFTVYATTGSTVVTPANLIQRVVIKDLGTLNNVSFSIHSSTDTAYAYGVTIPVTYDSTLDRFAFSAATPVELSRLQPGIIYFRMTFEDPNGTEYSGLLFNDADNTLLSRTVTAHVIKLFQIPRIFCDTQGTIDNNSRFLIPDGTAITAFRTTANNLMDNPSSVVSFSGSLTLIKVTLYYASDINFVTPLATWNLTYTPGGGTGGNAVTGTPISLSSLTGPVVFVMNCSYISGGLPVIVSGRIYYRNFANTAHVFLSNINLYSVLANPRLDVHPFNTYIGLAEEGATFTDNALLTISDPQLYAKGTQLSLYDNTANVNLPLTLGDSSGPTFFGYIPNSSIVPYNSLNVVLTEPSGITYDTYFNFRLPGIQPSINLGPLNTFDFDSPNGIIVPVLGYDPAVATYVDSNHPGGITLGLDGGQFLYGDSSGNSVELVPVSGVTLHEGDYPGATVTFGYQSQASFQIANRYNTSEYYVAPSNATLPGVTWSSSYVDENGLYRIADLSLFGIPYSNVRVNGPLAGNLQIVGRGNTWTGFSYNGTDYESGVISGITYDLTTSLAYNGKVLAGITLSPLLLPLNGGVTGSLGTAVGSIRNVFEGVTYGGSNNLQLRRSPGNNIVTIQNGAGVDNIGVDVGSTYNTNSYTYTVVIPGGTSINNLYSYQQVFVPPIGTNNATLTLGPIGIIGSTLFNGVNVPVLAVSGGTATYSDPYHPTPVTLYQDGGVIVYDNPIIQSGFTFALPRTPYPGQNVRIGYQSSSAAGYSQGTTFFSPTTSNFTLPGITWTSANAYPNVSSSPPFYTLTNLSIFGATANDAAPYATNLSVLHRGVTYGPFAQTTAGGTVFSNQASSTGVTYDVLNPLLSYSGVTLTGTTLPSMFLPLTAIVTVTQVSPTNPAIVSFSNLKYGNYLFTSTLQLVDSTGRTVNIVDGSGSITYTGAGDYNPTYNVVIPGGVSQSSLGVPNGGFSIVSNGTAGPTGPLSLNYVFNTTANQRFTFDLLGEIGGTGITYTETIILGIPTARMNTLLAFSTNWFQGLPGTTGAYGITYYQPGPDVLLALQTVAGPWLDAFTSCLTGNTLATVEGSTYTNLTSIVTGYSGTTCTDLVKPFQTMQGFTYHLNGYPSLQTDYLSAIPQEGVQNFRLSNINTPPLSTVVGDLAVDTLAGSTAAYTGLSGAIQSLFEQAAAAGMIQVSNQSPGSNISSNLLLSGTPYGTALGGTTFPVYGANWRAGQSVAIYVKFNLTKSRAYKLQAMADLNNGVAGATQAYQVVYGGVTFSFPGTLLESSMPLPLTYKILLQAY